MRLVRKLGRGYRVKKSSKRNWLYLLKYGKRVARFYAEDGHVLVLDTYKYCNSDLEVIYLLCGKDRCHVTNVCDNCSLVYLDYFVIDYDSI